MVGFVRVESAVRGHERNQSDFALAEEGQVEVVGLTGVERFEKDGCGELCPAERLFKVKVIKVNTLIGPDGKKRAYVKLSPETPAIDLATKLGLM